ncbi:bifunctional diaminohydroxyphosphoribosylaminopyrimidine deaminase/5-amino-6-(5-phosphoribosylamino)uracil reductase RibD [Leptolyngbya sp. FACHB-17]|uniref:bifunctional diaminohydroxyphosphoribosylaminopyrimidine deaminase/5-amino-6-(5-phosphoribosylamino)uracil reductase RibD n=1 Tax=unclassified Leptolyngbya TaxID=2650499 RepID=UPI00168064EA|nr:bifunctional diaminohydroxyphosphoribosylaminopyrimidine deaminase/5-amino-6-(5-phosphoribosylamino)uracil reductase RibD [Leptolyngbya sp. FACHB-17]MBD2078822.1 bifunctional diaminohydroxyphosphoribosylaminopyrimidine deaminase/5-amino-6-(5-phosphoribosylamino)uracil reductase RibD [Leptolyngbya sp. FACHB-17]
MSAAFDRAMMQRCLELARTAIGRTAPNPMVGCVIVADEEEIVGEGFHPKAGEPHAEVFALRQAGARSQGATLYVNLEPCNHYGRTPPCSEAVVEAGIRRVVVGMVDPNPKVAGSGIATLKQAGIEVSVGVEEADCQTLNEAFVHRILRHRPFGILKYAMTLDGKIAATSGHSSWVTGEASRHRVHQLRTMCDVIVIGGNTVRKDNPQLTTHGLSQHQPLRVVMSRTLNLPLKANLWNTESASTIVFTQLNADQAVQTNLIQQGVEVVNLEELTPDAVMMQLYDRGLNTVLWECGGILAAQAIAQGCVQKVWAFVAPKIIGGSDAPTPIGDLGLEKMTDAIQLARVRWQTIESDLLIEGYLGENG